MINTVSIIIVPKFIVSQSEALPSRLDYQVTDQMWPNLGTIVAIVMPLLVCFSSISALFGHDHVTGSTKLT